MNVKEVNCFVHPDRHCPIFDHEMPGCPAAIYSREHKMWFCSVSVIGMSMARHFFGQNYFSGLAGKNVRDKAKKQVTRLIKI